MSLTINSTHFAARPTDFIQDDNITSSRSSNIIPPTPRSNVPLLVGQPERIMTGVRGVTTVSNMPWLSTPITPGKQNRQKTTTKGKIAAPLNSIFAQCCTFVNDEFWHNILMEASRGKLPQNFTYSTTKNILSFKKKTKIESVEVPKDAYPATCVILDFFRNKAGMRSPSDLEREKKEQEEILLKRAIQSYSTWSEIKNKALKRAFFADYIHKLTEQYKLKVKERKELKTIINVGFLLGSLCNDDVDFDGYKINDIKGLKYDEVTRKFCLIYLDTKKKKNSYFMPTNLSDPLIEDKETCNFEATWNKFSSNFEPVNLSNIVPQTPGVIHSYRNNDTQYNFGSSSSFSSNSNSNSDISIAIDNTNVPLQLNLQEEDIEDNENENTIINPSIIDTPLASISYASSSYGYARTLIRSW